VARLKLEEACGISNYQSRVRNLLSLIPQLSRRLRREAQRRALEAIRRTGDQYQRTSDLLKLLQTSPESRLLSECLDLAKRNDNNIGRDEALGLLATLLASSGRVNLAIQAACACYGGGHCDHREAALKNLSVHLQELGKPVKAVEAAIQLRNEHERAQAIDRLASDLTPAVLSKLLVKYKTGHSQHTLAINALAPYLPLSLAKNTLQCSWIRDAAAQARLRIALAPFLPLPLRSKELQRAVRDALRLAADYSFSNPEQPLLDLIEDLPQESLLHALEASFKIEVSDCFAFNHLRFWDMCMPYLTFDRRQDLLRKIYHVVVTVKSETLIASAATLLASWGASKEALALAQRLSPGTREDALVGISDHLTAEDILKLLCQSKEEQWEPAMQIPLIVRLGTAGSCNAAFDAALAMNREHGAEALAFLCPILTTDRRAQSLKIILRATRSPERSIAQGSILLAIIPFLGGRKLQEATSRAMSIVEGCRWEWTRQSGYGFQSDTKKRQLEQFIRLLLGALPSIVTGDRDYFIHVVFHVLGWQSSRLQGELLPKLAETLPEPDRTGVFEEAVIEIAKSISETPISLSDRNDLLRPVTRLFCPGTISSTLRTIADSVPPACLVRFLRALSKWSYGWTQREPTLAKFLWQRALRDNATKSRAEMYSVLASLVPTMVDLVGNDAATELNEAMRRVASCWP
jgi:hypothetical protein